jgi:hypothetical protein
MATVELTKDNFEQVVTGNDMVVVFAQAGALPAEGLDCIISQARALDMAQVHREIAEQQAQQQQ